MSKVRDSMRFNGDEREFLEELKFGARVYTQEELEHIRRVTAMRSESLARPIPILMRHDHIEVSAACMLFRVGYRDEHRIKDIAQTRHMLYYLGVLLDDH